MISPAAIWTGGEVFQDYADKASTGMPVFSGEASVTSVRLAAALNKPFCTGAGSFGLCLHPALRGERRE
jgi:polysaccharide pyruvyl transferase WcaK-like protein